MLCRAQLAEWGVGLILVFVLISLFFPNAVQAALGLVQSSQVQPGDTLTYNVCSTPGYFDQAGNPVPASDCQSVQVTADEDLQFMDAAGNSYKEVCALAPDDPGLSLVSVNCWYEVSSSGSGAALDLGLVPCNGPECQFCHVASLVNGVASFVVGIITILAILTFVYAGFLLTTSAGSEDRMKKAKSIFINVTIGFVIVLGSWLIVNEMMRGLLAGQGQVMVGGNQYPWNAIICVDQPILSEGSFQYNVRAVDLGSLTQCGAGNTACSVSALQSAGFTSEQANVMSCIAMTESSGVPGTPPYNIANPSSNSTACGTFQVVRTTWNLYASGECSDFSKCTDAACNMQVAKVLVNRNGYNDWTCPNCNAKAAGCITKFGN